MKANGRQWIQNVGENVILHLNMEYVVFREQRNPEAAVEAQESPKMFYIHVEHG